MTSLAWSPAPKPVDSRFMDLSGDTYSALSVQSFVGRDRRGRHIWLCACVCGAETHARADHLRAGRVRSCGCVRDALAGTYTLAHGATAGGRRTPTYRSWKGMRERCLSEGSANYARYGGRGVTVCDRWADFAAFLADMGERPRGTSIERIDNDGDYEPGNCEWATGLQQARNRRNNRFVEWGAVRLTVSEWAWLTKLSAGTIIARLDRGWPPERTFTTSLQSPRRAA